jgi:hypothetical protein
MQRKLLGIISLGFDITGQLMIVYSAFVKYFRKNGNTVRQVHQLFVDFKKACDSVRGEVLHTILIEFGIPLKLVRLIKMCVYETYSRVQVGKHLSDRFLIKNCLKQGDALSPLFFNFALDCAIRRVQANQEGLKLNGTHQLLVYADDNVFGGSIHTVRKNTKALVITSRETGLEVNGLSMCTRWFKYDRDKL